MADTGIWREMARAHWVMACVARTREETVWHMMIAADFLSKAVAAESTDAKAPPPKPGDPPPH